MENDQTTAKKPLSTPAVVIGVIAVLAILVLIAVTGKFVGNTGGERILFPEGYSVSSGQANTAASAEATVTPPTPAPAPAKHTVPTDAEIAAAKKAGTRQATIETAKGKITVELYGKDAPLTTANFVKLAKSGFYDGLNFHRVEPGFVIQGGDPNGDGTGDPGYAIKLEIAPKLKHIKGALAMARSSDPDSAGCQFYITLDATPSLDGGYAVFGKVIKGMDVVEKIAIGDKINKITVL
ncbi:MAG: peptidylprolyl isomerase [Armatimonadota bacterium]